MSLITLRESAAMTSSAAGLTVPVNPSETNVVVRIDATASTALTTLDVDVQWSLDGTNFWELASQDSFTQITSTATAETKVFAVKGPFMRINSALVGTSVTFSVVAYAVN